jgi:hypothetical protein
LVVERKSLVSSSDIDEPRPGSLALMIFIKYQLIIIFNNIFAPVYTNL